MKRFGRKGQGAMEYLMTYGWAILVVMIVGVVLWQLGIFGGGPGAANTARGFGKIKIMEPSIKYTGSTLSFTLMNGAGQTVTGLQAIVNDTAKQYVCTPGTLGAGETYSCSGTLSTKTGGDSFSARVDINYSVTVAGTPVTHEESGTIRGAAEPT